MFPRRPLPPATRLRKLSLDESHKHAIKGNVQERGELFREFGVGLFGPIDVNLEEYIEGLLSLTVRQRFADSS